MTDLNIIRKAEPSDLPNEVINIVQRHKLEAFYEINALKTSNPQFLGLVQGDELSRSVWGRLQAETQADRYRNARVEAADISKDRPADEIIAYHGVTDPYVQDYVRQFAGQRDVQVGKVAAPLIIKRNRITDGQVQEIVKMDAARRDLKANMGAQDVIKRNEVTDEFSKYMLKKDGVLRDTDAGIDAQTAVQRNGVTDKDLEGGLANILGSKLTRSYPDRPRDRNRDSRG